MSEYGSLREKIAAESKERHARYAKFEAAYSKAVEAGRVAGENAKPKPMGVYNPGSGESWHVPEGVCGFAWVNVSPGNSSFAKWLAKKNLARKAYYGGMEIWMSAFGQSYERKLACAEAMAEVFRAELGVKAYAGGRLD